MRSGLWESDFRQQSLKTKQTGNSKFGRTITIDTDHTTKMLFSKTTKLTTAKVSIGALSILTLGFQAVKVSALDGLPPGPAPGIPAAGWLDPTKAPGYGVNPEGGTVWPT